MTSHKVTVGVYNVKTGKTVYLQAGDPTDRYFTNISWAPNEQHIYVIELNRDQNHSQLVRYNAVSGAKEAVVYEEKHPKYVEPQHPLTFLPWDDSKFIYWSQRSGFQHLYLMDTQKKTYPEKKHPKYVEPQHPLTFLPWDDSKFIYWSQRSGFQHLYLMDTQKKTYPEKEKGEDGETTIREYLQVTPLTQGDWLVQEILGFNAAKKEIIIGSTEVSPLQTNIYTLNVKTGKRTLIGKQDGTHQASLSANGTYLIDKFTSFSVPREISILPTNGKKGVNLLTSANGTYLIDKFTSFSVPREISILPTNGKKGVNLLTATDPMYEQYNMPEITIGTIKAADGVTDLYYRLIKPVDFDPNKKYPAIEITIGTIKAADGVTDLYYRLIKPVDFDPNKKYPAIIYVYGGPHAQLIHNNRFYDARGWDLYMAQKGYVMLTADSRGSDNRGLKFENVTFRHLGVEEMKDQVKGAEFLQSLPYVNPEKIGVHGWSFGGFMTTNLMLTYPDLFKVGVAGGPVIDWKYYEVMYGERYMDTPQTNPEGYKGSDLKQKAGNLKGRLQIIIGGTDPVCVPQHSYTFLRACIEAGTHPDYFIYPEDGHNMIGRDRVHLHEHITRYFDDYLF